MPTRSGLTRSPTLLSFTMDSNVEETVLRVGGVVTHSQSWGEYLRMTVNYEGEIQPLAEALLNEDGVELHSIGHASEVIKGLGTPVAVDDRYAVCPDSDDVVSVEGLASHRHSARISAPMGHGLQHLNHIFADWSQTTSSGLTRSPTLLSFTMDSLPIITI